jgi:class 3 adenylate cyclase
MQDQAVGASRFGGTPRFSFAAERARRRRKVINLVVALGIAVDLFFAGLYTVVDARAYALAIIINLANAALWAPTPLLHRYGGIWAGTWFLGVLIISMLAFTVLLGHASGSHLFLILVATLSLIFLGLRPIMPPLLATGLAWGAFVLAVKVLPEGPSLIPMSMVESQNIFYATSALTIAMIFLTSRYAIQLSDAAEAALVREYQRSDELLLNILPVQVAERLKSGERIADAHDSVSVLFADIVDFTEGAQRVGPEATVAMLSRFFSSADDLAERHGCEKIKTIGDCVMAAAGLPEPRADHAEVLARYALDLRKTVESETFAGAPLRLRIGLHSGPAVAGVIGRSRFAYDLWGDTVNLAARIQSASEPMEIQVSDATRRLLGPGFACGATREIEARGAGRVRVWRLIAET